MSADEFIEIYEDYKSKTLLVELLKKIGQKPPISTMRMLAHAKRNYEHAVNQVFNNKDA